MRKIILSVAVAAITAVSFAAPSQAGGWGHGRGHGWGHGWGHNGHHGGYVRVYDDYGYEPACFIKKIKKWDKWGNLHVKKIKICR